MWMNRSVKASSKWCNWIDEKPTQSGPYLTAWSSGSGKWVSLVQWYDTADQEWERQIPDMWAKINLPGRRSYDASAR